MMQALAQQMNLSTTNQMLLQQAQFAQQRQTQMNLMRLQAYQGPTFTPRGYDALFSLFNPTSFGSFTPQMPMMGYGPMPSYNNGLSYHPQPQNFWGTSNGNGYQQRGFGYVDSNISAGHYSNNVQRSQYGHGFQDIHSGFGSVNNQTHTFGSSHQTIATGSRTTNTQRNLGDTKQTINAGSGSFNKQLALGNNTSQAALAGGNSIINQEASGGASSKQAARAGNNSEILQTGGRHQFGRVERNGFVAQEAAPGGDARQTAVLGTNSTSFQRGGNDQEVNSRGNGTTSVMSTGSNGGTMTVNNEAGGHRAVFDTSGPGQKEINYNSHDGSTRLTYDVGSGRNANRNIDLKGGDDTADVRILDPKNHGDINVQLGPGNDKAILRTLPQNLDAKIRFDGGPSEGNNTFEYRPTEDGNYSIMRDGKIAHQVGTGGPVIHVDNMDDIFIFNANGDAVALQPPQPPVRRRGRRRR